MRWLRPSSPDHPEYAARVLVATSRGHLIVRIWTETASVVEAVGADGWTSDRYSFGCVDDIAAELEELGVPAAEAATAAADVAAEWRQRWHARTPEVRWPLFELSFYGAAAAVVVPALVGASVVLAALGRAVGGLADAGGRSRAGRRLASPAPRSVSGWSAPSRRRTGSAAR